MSFETHQRTIKTITLCHRPCWMREIRCRNHERVTREVADTLGAGNIPKLLSPLPSHCIPLSVAAATQTWGTTTLQGWRVAVTVTDCWHSEQGVTPSLCCRPSPGPWEGAIC